MGRRFSARESTTKNQLMDVMGKIKATSLKIETDEFSGVVRVTFDRKGRRYTKECKRWPSALDNLRAIGLNIAYLYRAIEVYGVKSEESESEFDELFNDSFVGIEATPTDSVLMLPDKNEWYQVLGVGKDASREAITSAYKALARVYHPDLGGDAASFVRLRHAFEEGLKEAARGGDY